MFWLAGGPTGHGMNHQSDRAREQEGRDAVRASGDGVQAAVSVLRHPCAGRPLLAHRLIFGLVAEGTNDVVVNTSVF